MKVGSFLIFGNDAKMLACKDELCSNGFTAEIYDGTELSETIVNYNYIILPLPTLIGSKIGGTDIDFDFLMSLLNENQRLFVGNLRCSSDDNVFSYYFNENFINMNSEYTAQGVLRLLLENVDSYAEDIKVAVTGYGRCGKAICKLLDKCGFDVMSFSRRAETVGQARENGIKADLIDILYNSINRFSVIINTVPENIFNNDVLTEINNNTVYIETASAPYGFDKSLADCFNFKYILGSGLPGKFLPRSAGINIAKTVTDILKEEENG